MSNTPVTLLSENPQDAKLEALKSLFPEAFSEWKLNTTILAKTLGEESLSSEKEAYGMTWAGKSDARKQILTPTTKTLIPDSSASVDYENTNNILIEWDNLEVLKLLQKWYSKEIKMIYIDPPYNTGKDFVYRDNFTSDKAEYEESTGQRDSDGNRLIQNTETNGRYHSDWLSMMYPRLHLARNLLRDDGAIFVSIDDYEAPNLRKIMDEIFGEENFVAQITWQRKASPKWVPPVNMIVKTHEYIIVYQKSEKFSFIWETRSMDSFSNPDNDTRWLWRNTNLKSTTSFNSFEIIDPNTGNKFTDTWAFSRSEIDRMIVENRLIFPKKTDGQVRMKEFFLEFENQNIPLITSLWLYDAQSITQSMTSLIGEKVFNNAKSIDLLSYLIKSLCNGWIDNIILDFFAWSGTTGHAVMSLNAEEKAEAVKNGTNPDEVGNRRYICVQLPEETDTKSEAYKAGYKKISEITAERLRRAGAKIREENPDMALDTGFRLYRLDESCYQVASIEYRSEDAQGTLESLEKAIQSGLSPLRDWVKEADVMVEVLLKEGFPLTSVWTEVRIGENTFLHTEYAGKQLYMSFESLIVVSTIQTLSREHSEAIFVVYDTALDDSRKVMLSARVKLRTI